MTETITNILQWLIPSGGLGAVIVWLTNKTLRNARTSKEVHDTYKQMYHDVQLTLIEIQDDNKKLYKVISRLERAVSKVNTCRYYPHCPVNLELQQQQGVDTKPKGRNRQRTGQGNKNSNIRADPDVENATDDTDGEPHQAAHRGNVQQ